MRLLFLPSRQKCQEYSDGLDEALSLPWIFCPQVLTTQMSVTGITPLPSGGVPISSAASFFFFFSRNKQAGHRSLGTKCTAPSGHLKWMRECPELRWEMQTRTSGWATMHRHVRSRWGTQEQTSGRRNSFGRKGGVKS